jgi:hypothetical protein
MFRLAIRLPISRLYGTRFYSDFKIIKVPTLADSITTGTLAQWEKSISFIID